MTTPVAVLDLLPANVLRSMHRSIVDARIAYPDKRYEVYGEAPQAIEREVGELLYVLARGEPSRLAV